MKWYFIVLIVLAVLPFVLCFAAFLTAYCLCFYNPKKNRADASIFLNPLYKPYLEKLKKTRDDIAMLCYEQVYIEAKDGLKLAANVYKGDPKKVMIVVHGYKGSPFSDSRVPLFLNLGYTVIAIFHRGHGKSGGHTITMGAKEKYDIVEWVDYARKNYPYADINIYGVSMGGATVLMASEFLNGKVAHIISDCPYNTIPSIMMSVVDSLKIPEWFGAFIIEGGARLFGHFTMYKDSCVEAVKKTEIPILIFHGTSDQLVPCALSREIQEANPKRIKRVEVEGALHAISYLEDRSLFTLNVMMFLGE